MIFVFKWQRTGKTSLVTEIYFLELVYVSFPVRGYLSAAFQRGDSWARLVGLGLILSLAIDQNYTPDMCTLDCNIFFIVHIKTLSLVSFYSKREQTEL